MAALEDVLAEMQERFDRALAGYRVGLELQETGQIVYLGAGVARVDGLPNVRVNEMLLFPGGRYGIAFVLEPDEIGVVLLDDYEALRVGDEVRRTGRVADVPVGAALLGRVVDTLGRPLDGRGAPDTTERWPVEREAPPILDRAPVDTPLQTGIKVVDSVVPIGRGQRELILGDRQTGKTAVAVDTIINQRDNDVICVYCAIGQRMSAVAKVVADLGAHDALQGTVVVVATGEDPPGRRYLAPYAATSIAEYYRDRGRHVLLVLDDLTRHARAYRELSLLLRRPPGREAYPGDIFYIHARLLERSTHLRGEFGGGTLTALPIIETQEQNLSAYIPTNLVSITDGQIYLSPELFQQGNLPAVDVGTSVSRVGGDAQLPSFQKVAEQLRLAYAQFEELEAFARFGTRVDESTRQALRRGRRIREIFKQPQYEPLSVAEQVAVLFALNEGLFDEVPLGDVKEVEVRVRRELPGAAPDLWARLGAGESLSEEEWQTLRERLEPLTTPPAETDRSSETDPADG